MRLRFPHSGTEAQGVAHIKKMLADNRAKIAANASDLVEKWEDNVLEFSFTAQGTHIEGSLTVHDKEYELYAKLPLALRLFEGTIEKMITAEAKKLSL